MKCECGWPTNHVIETRDEGAAVMRRRRCAKCGSTWRTFERRDVRGLSFDDAVEKAAKIVEQLNSASARNHADTQLALARLVSRIRSE